MPPPTPGKAGVFSDLPFRTPKDLPGWLVAVGSLVGAIAFVLPFSGGYVIGGGVDPSYFGLWGLANPANLVLMLAVDRRCCSSPSSRAASRCRSGPWSCRSSWVGWFLGVVWGYATGPFGLGLGADAIAIGAIVLIIGGALAAARADDPPKKAPGPDAP